MEGGGGVDVVHGIMSSDSDSDDDDGYVYQNGGTNPEGIQNELLIKPLFNAYL